MLPETIIKKVKEQGIDVICISDHNATENVLEVKKVGNREGITVIGGMEITSKEEVHVLAFFNDDSDLNDMQRVVYDNLPGTNNQELYGYQCCVDEFGYIKFLNQHLLIGATTLSIEEVVDAIHRFNGIAIAAHVDREAFSIVNQLGFIPEELEFDALEISSECNYREFSKKYISKEYGIMRYPIVSFSDAHKLDDIGKRCTIFICEKPTVESIKEAIKGVNRVILCDNSDV